MIAKRVIGSLPFIVIAFTATLALAQDVTGDDERSGSGCIDEGRARGRGLGDRAAPVYPFAVGSRAVD